MKEYKLRRGEYLEDRIPDIEATVKEYFGPVTGTEEYGDSELFVIEEPKNPVFESITVGAVEYSRKKDRLAVDFRERNPAELGPAELEAAEDALATKNEFLLEATGRDATARRESLKRAVEDDDADVPEA